jgi:hypothetical protein
MQSPKSTDLLINLGDKAIAPNLTHQSINDANAMEFDAVQMLEDDEPTEEEESGRLLPNNYARTRKEFVAQELYVLESDREDKIRHHSVRPD